MNSLFLLNEEEKKHILNLHKNAIKKNSLSEQTTPPQLKVVKQPDGTVVISGFKDEQEANKFIQTKSSPQPTTQPAQPAAKPAQPTAQKAQPTAQPAQPAAQPKPAQPAAQTAKPTNPTSTATKTTAPKTQTTQPATAKPTT